MWQMFSKKYANRGVWQAVALGLLLLFSFSFVHAEDSTDDVMALQQSPQVKALTYLSDRYPAGSITTMEAANRAVGEVRKMRTVIDAQFATEQGECHGKFFATVCLSDAKERHRTAVDQLRRIEIEANKFKRRANVAERDRMLATKRDKGAAVPTNAVMKDPNHLLDVSEPVSRDLQPKDHTGADQRVRKHWDGMK